MIIKAKERYRYISVNDIIYLPGILTHYSESVREYGYLRPYQVKSFGVILYIDQDPPYDMFERRFTNLNTDCGLYPLEILKDNK